MPKMRLVGWALRLLRQIREIQSPLNTQISLGTLLLQIKNILSSSSIPDVGVELDALSQRGQISESRF